MYDSDLVEKLKNGDTSAFDELYEKYKNMIFHTAVYIMGNRSDAEEIVQECFISCYVHIKELKNSKQFKSWLYHILIHLAWRESKRKNMYTKDLENEIRGALNYIPAIFVNTPLLQRVYAYFPELFASLAVKLQVLFQLLMQQVRQQIIRM